MTATAVAASFLPPPTLTSGDPFRPGGLFPGAAAPLSAPPVTPIARPAGTNPDANPPAAGGLARLIDRGALLLTYVWLGCGALTVAGLVVGAVWFLRRHP